MPLRPALSTLRGIGLTILVLGAWAACAGAWDYTELTVIDPVMVDGNPAVTVGQGFSVRVRTMNDGGSVDTGVNALLFTLYTTHNATLPPAEYVVNGEVQFDNVVFNAPGIGVQLEARAMDDPTAPKGYEWINAYAFVHHFNVIVPAGNKWVGQAIAVQLVAVDAAGIPIGNFADDVTLRAQIGNLGSGPSQLVTGASFDHGSAFVNVQFLGTHILTRTNTLTATNTRIYQGQADYPSGSAAVSPLWPGGLNHVVILLPGESLTPGVPPGKDGNPAPQAAGIPFDTRVYAVDAWWNPVLDTDPALPVHLSFSSSDAGPGVVLPPDSWLDGNLLPDQSFTLVTSALHQASVHASGPITDTSSSFVQILPLALDHFDFNYAVWDTLDVQVTTQPFDLKITARDFFGNLFPFNGPVSLRVKFGPDESADYVLAGSNIFIDGQLDTDMQVTRRFFSCQLVCDSGGSASTASGAFRVDPGPLDGFLTTFPGQTYAPGFSTPGYTGNLGNPNPTTAGQVVTPVVIRPVDAYYNMVGGTHFVGASSLDGFFELPDYSDNNFTVANATEIDLIMRTFGPRTLTITSSGGQDGTSSYIQVSPAAYARMAVVAPGEDLAPGIFDAIEADGKIGAPSPEDAGIPFSVDVFATDQFWNPVSANDPALPITLAFESSDSAADLPPGGLLSASSGSFSVTLRTLSDPNLQTVQAEDVGHDKSAFAAIPLQAGVIDHFDIGINSRSNPTPSDPLDPIPDIYAGQVLQDLTFIARDQFGNHIPTYNGLVRLTVNHGAGIMTPDTLNFADNGTWTGDELGVWRGGLQIFKSGTDVVLTATDLAYMRSAASNPFDVLPGSYEDVLIMLPGEIHTPGIPPGKAGFPLPSTAGQTMAAVVMAVDHWFNRVPTQPTLQLASEGYSVVTSANPFTLQPEGIASPELYFRSAGDLDLYAFDVTFPDQADTSVAAIQPGPFDRLQIVAPGETPNPGGYEADGKLGSPAIQVTSLQFPVTVRSVDAYWNLVLDNDEHIRLASSDGALNEMNPTNQGQNLSGGLIDFLIFLTDNGPVTVEADPLDNLDILPQAVTINMLQGSLYVIEAPNEAYVGPPNTFPMSVSLVDSLGLPEAAANNTFTLTAFKSNLDPASSVLWVSQATLNAGQVEIPAQAYDTVEDIIIRVTDDASRIAYSQPIHMLTNGIEYSVAVDSSTAIAGPPATFPVTVELRDVDTGTPVDSDRTLVVSVWSAVSGAPGLGMTGITQASLQAGRAVFNQSYSRAENVFVHIEDEAGLSANSPIFNIVADGYKRLQILVPGEEVRAGQELYMETGKTGTPDRQRSRIPFPVTVRAVDQYWNLADTTNSGGICFSATDNSIGAGNPDAMNVPFVAGRRTFQIYLASEGQVDLSTWDCADPDPPGQTVAIGVDPGYEYRITTPDTQPQTGFPGFQVIVEMIDPLTGDPAPDANNSFAIAALNPDLSMASGNLAITAETLAEGVRVINNEQYDRVEPIILRISDAVGRVGYSERLDFQSGGLVYQIEVPDSATVGGPATFPVTVRLMDMATGLVVMSQDATFSVEVYSGQTGLIGAGAWSVGSSVLVKGIASFNQSYTAAEDIYLRVNDARGVLGISSPLVMLPDGYKRLQIVAPGETPVPGVSSPTGKVGEPILQQAEVPFMMQVRATDQYWNLIDDFAAGAVELSSSDGSLGAGNPVNQGAPFVGGVGDYQVLLHNQGNITVFAEDTDNPAILAHAVSLPVGQAHYEILVPETAHAGPPATFSVTVRLVKTDGELITSANHQVFLTAMKPNHAEASDTLGISVGTLAAGELAIADQYYGAVEDIIIRVTDDLDRVSYSAPIHMIPENVTYEITTPPTATVGPPAAFDVAVRLIDTATGQLVISENRSFTVAAFNHNTGAPGSGVLGLTSGTTAEGLCDLTQTYTAAETIYLAISDDTGTVVFSDPIQVKNGPPQNLIVASLESVLEVGQSTALTASLTDLFGNAVINHPVAFALLAGDGVLAADSVYTGSLGVAHNTVQVPEGGREDILIRVSVDNLPDRQIAIEVIGPPLTQLSLDGTAVKTGHGVMVTPQTTFSLTSSSEIGLYRIYYGVDLGPEGVPQIIYEQPLSFADLGLTAYGEHTLSFFAEDIKGHKELVQTFSVMMGSELAADKAVTNRPNPFHAGREETLILFRAPGAGTAAVQVYDLFGNLVWSTELSTSAGATYQVPWDGRNGHGEVVGNGGYICTIRSGGELLKRKIAVVK